MGIDALLNLKGYHDHHGLEGYHSFETHNLGSQVPNSVLVAKAIEIVEAEGRRRETILACGGPRVSN